MLLSLFLAFAVAQDNPYLMDPKNTLTVASGGLYETKTGRAVTIEQIAAAADGAAFVLIGESHDNAEHHKFQADVIRALAARGRNTFVGMEMFPFTAQTALNNWTLGKLSEEEFIQRSDWKKAWGFDYALYKPIFDAVREYSLPLLGLNVPRDMVRKVGRSGPSGLAQEEYGDIPALDLTFGAHKELFLAMIGGSAAHGAMSDNMYAAQVLWDTAMASSARRFWNRYPRFKSAVSVVLAGSGHIMYDYGIGYRLKQMGLGPRLVLVGLDMEPGKPFTFSRSIGDYVYITERAQKP